MSTLKETFKKLLDVPHRPKIGIALGGGGARGFAHIGVLEALQAAHVPLDVVVGTSMGAIIGCAYVCGLDMQKLTKLLKALDLHALLAVPHSPIPEMVERTASELLFKKAQWREEDRKKTKRLIEFYQLLTHNRSFEDLDIPFAAVACDIDTGRQVVMQQGKLHRALAASVALPGIHDPVLWKNHTLVDGGIINKLPADVAVELGADIVIAVDVSAMLTGQANTSLQVMAQATHITSRELMWTQLELLQRRLGPRLVIVSPIVAGIKTLNLNEVEAPVEAGKAATGAIFPELQQALVHFAQETPADSPPYAAGYRPPPFVKGE